MGGEVGEVVKQWPEGMRFVRGLRTYVGFRQIGLAYERAEREAGKPKYSFKALARLALHGVISFSSYPLHLVTYLGFLSILVALLVSGIVVFYAFERKSAPPGGPSTMFMGLFMGTGQLSGLEMRRVCLRRV